MGGGGRGGGSGEGVDFIYAVHATGQSESYTLPVVNAMGGGGGVSKIAEPVIFCLSILTKHSELTGSKNTHQHHDCAEPGEEQSPSYRVSTWILTPSQPHMVTWE